MPDALLSLEQCAQATGRSISTIKRMHRRGAFAHAVRGLAQGRRTPPWLVPVSDLLDAGLTPNEALIGRAQPLDRHDPEALCEHIARLEGVLAARDGHLHDLRRELDRLHERVNHLQDALVDLLASRRARPGDGAASPHVASGHARPDTRTRTDH
jgi:hypothetical protein